MTIHEVSKHLAVLARDCQEMELWRLKRALEKMIADIEKIDAKKWEEG